MTAEQYLGQASLLTHFLLAARQGANNNYLKTRSSLPEMIQDPIQELSTCCSLPHYSLLAKV